MKFNWVKRNMRHNLLYSGTINMEIAFFVHLRLYKNMNNAHGYDECNKMCAKKQNFFYLLCCISINILEALLKCSSKTNV